jgi:hypothetical protein
MLPPYAESRARLERLLDLAMKEMDPMKRDEITAEIRLVLDERERARSGLRDAQSGRE